MFDDFDRFHEWFDALPEPKRTAVFMGIMLPVIIMNALSSGVGLPIILIFGFSRYNFLEKAKKAKNDSN